MVSSFGRTRYRRAEEAGNALTSASARPRVARAGTGLVPRPDRNYRVSLAWPRLPAAAEVAIVAAGYAGYALVRLAVRASRPVAIAHAAGLWRAERWLHLDIEPSINHLAAARPVLAETAGYYYGLAHFIVTPLVLVWLWLRQPAAFGPLRTALTAWSTCTPRCPACTWPGPPGAPPRSSPPPAAGGGTWPDSTQRPPRSWCSPRPTTSSPTPPPAWPSPPWACSPPAPARGRMPPSPDRAVPGRRPPRGRPTVQERTNAFALDTHLAWRMVTGFRKTWPLETRGTRDLTAGGGPGTSAVGPCAA